jgi:hypothetical protein
VARVQRIQAAAISRVVAECFTRWSIALARCAIGHRAGNRDVLPSWIARWTSRAEAAAVS